MFPTPEPAEPQPPELPAGNPGFWWRHPPRQEAGDSLQIFAFGLKETDDFRQRTDQPLADTTPTNRGVASTPLPAMLTHALQAGAA